MIICRPYLLYSSISSSRRTFQSLMDSSDATFRFLFGLSGETRLTVGRSCSDSRAVSCLLSCCRFSSSEAIVDLRLPIEAATCPGIMNGKEKGGVVLF